MRRLSQLPKRENTFYQLHMQRDGIILIQLVQSMIDRQILVSSCLPCMEVLVMLNLSCYIGDSPVLAQVSHQQRGSDDGH